MSAPKDTNSLAMTVIGVVLLALLALSALVLATPGRQTERQRLRGVRDDILGSAPTHCVRELEEALPEDRPSTERDMRQTASRLCPDIDEDGE